MLPCHLCVAPVISWGKGDGNVPLQGLCAAPWGGSDSPARALRGGVQVHAGRCARVGAREPVRGGRTRGRERGEGLGARAQPLRENGEGKTPPPGLRTAPGELPFQNSLSQKNEGAILPVQAICARDTEVEGVPLSLFTHPACRRNGGRRGCIR